MGQVLANHKRQVLMFLCLIFINLPTFAFQSPNIEVKVHNTPQGQAVSAHMEVSFSPSDFIALIKIASFDCSWIEHCLSVQVHEGAGSDYQLVQTELESPWPFKNRLMLVYSTLTLSKDMQTLNMRFLDAVDAPYTESDTHVRMGNVSGSWQMTPINVEPSHSEQGAGQNLNAAPAKSTYLLSYEGVANANGNIPKWLAVKYVKTSTKQTFQNIRSYFQNASTQ